MKNLKSILNYDLLVNDFYEEEAKRVISKSRKQEAREKHYKARQEERGLLNV